MTAISRAMRTPGYNVDNALAPPSEGEGADDLVEIEGEDEDESTETGEDEPSEILGPDGHYGNLCHQFTDDELKKIGSKVLERYEADKASREQWLANLTKGLKILGVDLNNSDAALWNGSCTASHPLCLETGVKLQQKLSSELFPSGGPTRTRIRGTQTEAKILQANRVKAFMDYQIQESPDFDDESDKTILHMGIFGTCFKKNYWSNEETSPVSEMVRQDLLVVNQAAKNIDRAERLTHMDPISVRTMEGRMETGYYRELPVSDPEDDVLDYDNKDTPPALDSDSLTPGQIDLGEFNDEIERIMGTASGSTDYGFLVLDHYCYWNFKGFDFGPKEGKLPYIITVDHTSGNVLRICRDWSDGDVTCKRNKTFTAYNFIPFDGIYSLGLIHLLGNFNMALTAIMRSLVDAGQLYNLQGGYKLKGARIVDNSNGYSMGEFKDVEGIAGNKLGDSFLPHQFKEPSQVLFAMMQFLDGRGGEFANATDQVVANNPGYGNVGSTQALLEVAEKLYTGIYKRGRKSVTRDLQIQARLNFEFLGDDPYPFSLSTGEEQSVIGSDFDPRDINVEPSADPEVPSQAKRAAIEQAKLGVATQAKAADPNLNINLEPIIRKMYLSLDPLMDQSELFPAKQEAKPQDPLSDIIACTQGMPIKAFPGQNHQAHIMFKNAWLMDPNQGASQIMQPFIPSIQANIREHQLMGFQEQIGAMVTGVDSDPKTHEMLMAQAAQEISRVSQLTANMDSPEAMVAKAVKLEAETKAKKEDRESRDATVDQIIKLGQTAVASQREANRKAEVDSKADLGVLQTVADNSTKILVEKLKGKGRSKSNGK